MSKGLTKEEFDKVEGLTSTEINPTTNLPENKGTESNDLGSLSSEDFELVNRVASSQSNAALGKGDLNLNPDEFDFQLKPNQDNKELRAQDQSITGMIAKGTGRLITTTATKFLSGVGYAATAIPALLNGDMSVMLDNSWSNMYREAEEYAKDSMPIYKTKKYTEGNVLDQMGTLGFWMDDVVDGAAFMLSSVIGAKGLGAAAKGIGAYSKLARQASVALNAAKAGKDISKFGNVLQLKRFADAATMGSITAFNTVNESAFEAKDLKDSLLASFKNDIELGNMSQEEANIKASEAAKTSFWTNMAILAPSNLLETSMLFKTASKGGLNDIIRAGRESGKTFEQIANELPMDLTKKQMAKTFGKNAIQSSLSEGVYEENSQTALQNYLTSRAHGKEEDTNLATGLVRNWVENFSTDEGQKAMAMGAIVGLIPGGIGGVREARAETQQLANQSSALASYLTMASTGLRDMFVHETTKDEQGNVTGYSDKIKLDENQQPIRDEKKLKGIFQGSLKSYLNYTRGLQAMLNGNKEVFDAIRQSTFSDYAFNVLESGGDIETLDLLTDTYVETETNDLKEAGMLTDENKEDFNYLQDTAEKYKALSKKLVKLHKSINNNYAGLANFGKTEDAFLFKNQLKYAQFSEANNQMFLNDKIKELEHLVLKGKVAGKGTIEGVSGITDIEVANDIKAGKEASKMLTPLKAALVESESTMKDLLDYGKQQEIFDEQQKAIREASEARDVAEDNTTTAAAGMTTKVKGKSIKLSDDKETTTFNKEQAEANGYTEDLERSAILNEMNGSEHPSYFYKVDGDNVHIVYTDGSEEGNITSDRKIFGRGVTRDGEQGRTSLNFLNDVLDKAYTYNFETGDIVQHDVEKIKRDYGKRVTPEFANLLFDKAVAARSAWEYTSDPITEIEGDRLSIEGVEQVQQKSVDQHRSDVQSELANGLVETVSKVQAHKDNIRDDRLETLYKNAMYGTAYHNDGRSNPIEINGKSYKNTSIFKPSNAIGYKNGEPVSVTLQDENGKLQTFTNPFVTYQLEELIMKNEQTINDIFEQHVFGNNSDGIAVTDPKTGINYAVFRKNNQYEAYFIKDGKSYKKLNPNSKIRSRVIEEAQSQLDKSIGLATANKYSNEKEFKKAILNNAEGIRGLEPVEALSTPTQEEVVTTPVPVTKPTPKTEEVIEAEKEIENTVLEDDFVETETQDRVEQQEVETSKATEVETLINEGDSVETLDSSELPEAIVKEEEDDSEWTGTKRTDDNISYIHREDGKFKVNNIEFLQHVINNPVNNATVEAQIDYDYREFWDTRLRLEGGIKNRAIKNNLAQPTINGVVSKEKEDFNKWVSKEYPEFDKLVDFIPIKYVYRDANGDIISEHSLYAHQSNFKYFIIPPTVGQGLTGNAYAKAVLEYKRLMMTDMRKHRADILSQLLLGNTIRYNVTGKTMGHFNTVKDDTNFGNILDVLGDDYNSQTLALGLADGHVYAPGDKYKLTNGTKGGIYWSTNRTANGKQTTVRLNPAKISPEHARIVLKALRQFNKGVGVYEGTEVTGGLRPSEVINHLTTSGKKRTEVPKNNKSKSRYVNKQLWTTPNGILHYGVKEVDLHNMTPLEEKAFVDWMVLNKNYPVNKPMMGTNLGKNFSIGTTMEYNPSVDNYTSFLIKSGTLNTRLRVVDGTKSITTNPAVLLNKESGKTIQGKKKAQTAKPTPTKATPKPASKPAQDANKMAEGEISEVRVKSLDNIFKLRDNSILYFYHPGVSDMKIPFGYMANGAFNRMPGLTYTDQYAELNDQLKGLGDVITKDKLEALKKKMSSVYVGNLYADIAEATEEETVEETKPETSTKITEKDITKDNIKDYFANASIEQLRNLAEDKEGDNGNKAFEIFDTIDWDVIQNEPTPTGDLTEEDKLNSPNKFKLAQLSATLQDKWVNIDALKVYYDNTRAKSLLGEGNEFDKNRIARSIALSAKQVNPAIVDFVNGETVEDTQDTNTDTLDTGYTKGDTIDPNDALEGLFRLKTMSSNDYKRFNPRKAKRWLRSRLGFGYDIEIVDGLIDLANDKHAFGQARVDSIRLSDAAEIGTEFHEAFHRVSRFLLKKEQRDQVYKDAISHYKLDKNISEKELEEVLAEKFRDYMLLQEENYNQKSLTKKIKSFFKKIYDFIKNIFTGNNKLNDLDVLKLFRMIDEGRFALNKVDKSVQEEFRGDVWNFTSRGVPFDYIQDSFEYKEVIKFLYREMAYRSGLIATTKIDGKSTTTLNIENGVKDLNKLSYNGLKEGIIERRNKFLDVVENNKTLPQETLNQFARGANILNDVLATKEIDGKKVRMFEDVIKLDLENFLRSLNTVAVENTDLDTNDELNEDTGETKSDFDIHSKNSFEYSSKQSSAADIKLLLSVLPVTRELNPKTGLPSYGEFTQIWSKLLRDNLDIDSVEDMEDVLKSEPDYIPYVSLLEFTNNREDVKTKLFNVVSKARLHFISQFINREENSTDINIKESMIHDAKTQLVKEWNSTFLRNSGLFTRETGKDPVPHVDEFMDIRDRYQLLLDDAIGQLRGLQKSEDYKFGYGELYNGIQMLLGEIGINISNTQLDALLGAKNDNLAVATVDFLNEDMKYIFSDQGTLFKLFNGLSAGRKVNFQNAFSNEQNITNIADTIAGMDEIKLGDSHLGPEGKRFFLITQHTTLTNQETQLRKDPVAFTEEKMSAAFNKNSMYLNYFHDNPTEAKNFGIKTLSTVLREGMGDKGRGYQDVTDKEEYILRLNASNKGYATPTTPESRRFYQYFKGIPRVGDNSTSNDVKKRFVRVDSNLNVDADTLAVFMGYLKDEDARAKLSRAQIDNALNWITGEGEEVFDPRELVQNIHYDSKFKGDSVVDEGEVVIATDATGNWIILKPGESALHGNGKRLKIGKKYTGIGSNMAIFTKKLSSESPEQYIQRILSDRIKEELVKLKKLGVVPGERGWLSSVSIPTSIKDKFREQVGDKENAIVEAIIADNVVNNIATGLEMMKVFNCDLATYKHVNDSIKRITGLTSTGDNLRTNYPTGVYANDDLITSDQYTVTTFTSHVVDSPMYDEIRDKYVDYYTNDMKDDKGNPLYTADEVEEIVDRKLAPYHGVDQTDAQTYITAEMHRAIKVKLGEWSQNKEDAYQLALSVDWDLSKLSNPEQLIVQSLVNEPLKLIYRKSVQSTGQSYSIFDKMSLSVLYRPTLKGTQLEELLDRMEAKGKYAGQKPIHQVKFNTAEKSGARDVRKLYADETETAYTDLNLVSTYAQDFKWLRKQLVTDPHESDHLKLASQMYKMGCSNVMFDADYINKMNDKETFKGRELVDNVQSIITELSDRGVEDVKNKLKLSDDLTVTDKKLFYETLLKEAQNANMPQNVLDALAYDPTIDDSYLDVDSVAGSRKWYQSRVISTINKAVIDIELPGNAFIQMSDFGLRQEGVVESDELRWNDEQGFIECQVSVNLFKHIIPNYKNKTHAQRVAFLNKNKDLVALGYRVPVQGQNSNFALKVVKWLPENQGDTIVLPKEGTAVAGFDFDIDKLYVVRHNYKNGKRIEFLNKYNSTPEQRARVFAEDKLSKKIRKIYKDKTESKYKSTREVEDYEDYLQLIDEDLYNEARKKVDSLLDAWVKDNIESFPDETTDELSQNTTKAIQNRLIDLYMTVWHNKHHYVHRMQPLGDATERLSNLSEDISKWTGESKIEAEPLAFLTPTEQIAVKSRFKFGGKGIAPYALANVHHILSQLVDLQLPFNIGVGNTTTEYYEEEVDVLDDDKNVIGKKTVTNESIYTSVAKRLGQDKEFITEWFSGILDGHLDMGTNPFMANLNATDYTNNTIELLIRAGVGGMSTFKFIAQPILKEISLAVQNVDDKLEADASPAAIKARRKDILFGIRKKYTDAYVKLGGNVKGLAKGEAAVKKQLSNEKELENNFKKIGSDKLDKQYYANQLEILNAFNFLSPWGQALSDAVMASRIDNKKAGSSVPEIKAYQRNVDTLVRKSKKGVGIRNFDKLMEKTYLGAQTRNSIGLSNNALSQTMLEGSRAFNELHDTILTLTSNYDKPNAQLVNDVSRGIYSQIASDFFVNKLGYDSDKVSKLFTSTNSIPKQIEDIKAGNKWSHLQDNPMFNKDYYLLTPHSIQDGPDVLVVRKPEDPFHVNTISDGWLDLLLDPNEDIRQFANDLYVYSYFTSGFKPTANSFHQFAPKELVRGIGYDKYIRNLKKDMNNPNLFSGYLEEVISNMWDNSKIVPEIIEDNITEQFNNIFLRGRIIAVDGEVLQEYTKGNGSVTYPIYIKKGFGMNTTLYKHVGDIDGFGDPVYMLVPKKGFKQGGFNVIENGLSKSTFNPNNDVVIVNYEDPKTNQQLTHKMDINIDNVYLWLNKQQNGKYLNENLSRTVMVDPRNITGKPNDAIQLVDSTETDKSNLNRPISNYPGITQGIIDFLDNVVTGDISLKMDIETGWYTTQSGDKIYLENKGDDLYHVEKLYGKQNPTKGDVDNRGIEC